MTAAAKTTEIKLSCVMSGDCETLTVKAVGAFGVSFKYSSDASVIVQGHDLRRVRAILDQQIANWSGAKKTAKGQKILEGEALLRAQRAIAARRPCTALQDCDVGRVLAPLDCGSDDCECRDLARAALDAAYTAERCKGGRPATSAMYSGFAIIADSALGGPPHVLGFHLVYQDANDTLAHMQERWQNLTGTTLAPVAASARVVPASLSFLTDPAR
jgi:hypothetical protein